jgi:hypothetical protein
LHHPTPISPCWWSRLNLLQLAAARRYTRRRELAYRQAEALIGLPGENGLLTPITSAAIEAWRATWRPLQTFRDQYGEWDWVELGWGFRNDTDRFEMALWSGHHLCGLAIGRPSGRHASVGVRFVEGSPVSGHPFKGRVLKIVAATAAAYALQINASKVRFLHPYPAVIPLYEEEKFHYYPRRGTLPPCCERVI